jgi:hypothetical protein
MNWIKRKIVNWLSWEIKRDIREMLDAQKQLENRALAILTIKQKGEIREMFPNTVFISHADVICYLLKKCSEPMGKRRSK